MDKEKLYDLAIGIRFTKMKWTASVLLILGVLLYLTPFSFIGAFVAGVSSSFLVGAMVIKNELKKHVFFVGGVQEVDGKLLFFWKGAKLEVDPSCYPIKWIDSDNRIFTFSTGIIVCSASNSKST